MSLSNRKAEVETKLGRLRARLAANNLEAVVLRHTANMAWLTAGASTFIYEATEGGVAQIVVTPDRAYVVTTTIEAPRLRQEEMLADLGFEITAEPWYGAPKAVESLTAGKRTADDGSFAAELLPLRSVLQPEEVARMRQVGRVAAEAMDEAIRPTRPGDSEYLLAARLAAAGRKRGGQVVVNLIASDDRIFQYRHPLPANKQVERYAMLVLCLRMEGLIASVTRLVHFGPLSDELRRKAAACARVDARLILGTQPGRTLSDMFALAKQAYTDEGYPEAIEEHHQGGSAAYAPRELTAKPGDMTPVVVNQAFAWNPSIRGVKVEDTFLLTAAGPEVITVIPGWPTSEIAVDGKAIARPDILVM